MAIGKSIALLLLISLLVFASGCTSAPSSKCGNGALDQGEECDGSAGSCSGGRICTETCRCESLTPPQLPE